MIPLPMPASQCRIADTWVALWLWVGETGLMARDRMEWLGCDVAGCPAQISGPSRRLTRDARAAGWVRQLMAVWVSEDDAGETWSDLCPRDAADAYTRWAGEYVGRYEAAPWSAALVEARARVSADVATASPRAGHTWSHEIEAGDAEPMTVLTAVVLLLGGWLLLPEVCEIGPRVAEAVRPRVWSSPAAITLPGPALAELPASEREVLEQLCAADEGTWRRWGACLSRVLDDRPHVYS